MAAETLPEPGTAIGPCGEPECAHVDCQLTRAMAGRPCAICAAPIGYGTRFYADSPGNLTHATCKERLTMTETLYIRWGRGLTTVYYDRNGGGRFGREGIDLAPRGDDGAPYLAHWHGPLGSGLVYVTMPRGEGVPPRLDALIAYAPVEGYTQGTIPRVEWEGVTFLTLRVREMGRFTRGDFDRAWKDQRKAGGAA